VKIRGNHLLCPSMIIAYFPVYSSSRALRR
jgi:hypothetical protein